LNRLSRAHERYIRQTDDRQTDGRAIAYSEREREFTFAKNQLKLAGVPQSTGPTSAASRPKFTILCGHVEKILLLSKFFRLSMCALVANIYPTNLCNGAQMEIFRDFLRHVFQRAACHTFQKCIINSQTASLPYFHTWCGPSANLECRSEICCARLAGNARPKKSPKIHRLGTITHFCRAVFATKARINFRKKVVKLQCLPPHVLTIW